MEGEQGGSLDLQSSNGQLSSFLRATPFDSSVITNLIPLIVQQCKPSLVLSNDLVIQKCIVIGSRLSSRMFRPFPTESGLLWRVNDSEVTRWTMFIGSKIIQAGVEGNHQGHLMGWIDRLHRAIIGSPASHVLARRDINARLSGLREVGFSISSRLIYFIDASIH